MCECLPIQEVCKDPSQCTSLMVLIIVTHSD